MNTYKKFASAMMTLALLVSAFNMPMVYTAHAQTTDDSSSLFDGLDFGGFNFPTLGFGDTEVTSAPVETTSVDTSNTTSGLDFGTTDQGTLNFGTTEEDTSLFSGLDFGTIDFGTIDFGDVNFGDINFGDVDFGTVDFGNATCNITATDSTIFAGGSVTLNFDTTGYDTVKLNGETLSNTDGSVTINNVFANTTYTITATGANVASCTASVTIVCLPPPIDCRPQITKTVHTATANVNDVLTYTITVKNVGGSDCNGVKIEDALSDQLTYLTQTTPSNFTAGYGSTPVYTASDRTLHFNGNVLTPGEQGTITFTARVNTPTSCGNFDITNQARVTAHELNNSGVWVTTPAVRTTINYDCPNNSPAPLCDSFTATPSNITIGNNASLAWQTSNATRVVINNGVGDVAADGSVSVSPLTTTTYVLTVFGTENRTVNCSVPVTIGTDTAPVCEYFTATPNSFNSNGGVTTLSWKVNGASNVSISPTIGAVAALGTQTTNVTQNTNFVLTATDSDGDQVTCAAPVNIGATQDVFSCANNVSFSASDSSIRRGDDSVLTWNTTNVDTVSISNLGSVTLGGSRSVEPRSDTTYVLTATRGTQSVNCPLNINVSSGGGGGGGGGGSKTPRCEFSISDNKIRSGEQVTLKWDSKNATDLMIKDNHGKTIVDTDSYASSKKKDYFDGSEKLRPTRDTEYTLTVSRGSKDRVCKVKVDVEDIKVLTDREPTVAGISLDAVPYTGFEAGPFLTILFYVLLIGWALFVTYLIVARRKPVLSTNTGMIAGFPMSSFNAMKEAAAVRPDLFPAQVVPQHGAPTAPVASVFTPTMPANLPVAQPFMGAAHPEVMNAHQATDTMVTDLENRAHAQMALLSSDAIRHFIATTEGTLERNESLDQVISAAKGQYPLEDGWIVINEARMRSLCETCMGKQTPSQNQPFVPAVVPEGSSSLAEAIVTGNIVAAYEMIGNRPMFSLADAAADLDAVLRMRRGEQISVSDLLSNETNKLSEDKLKNMITALTGALDGTYTDEASAVKMAIMKAVKEVA